MDDIKVMDGCDHKRCYDGCTGQIGSCSFHCQKWKDRYRLSLVNPYPIVAQVMAQGHPQLLIFTEETDLETAVNDFKAKYKELIKGGKIRA